MGEVKAGLSEGLNVFDLDQFPQAGVVVRFELAHADCEGRRILKLDAFGVPPLDARAIDEIGLRVVPEEVGPKKIDCQNDFQCLRFAESGARLLPQKLFHQLPLLTAHRPFHSFLQRL